MNRIVVKANLVVFIASFCTLVIELVAGRIMAPYVGVSLYTWTSIIGVVLAGISIGAWLGGILADRYPRQATLGWLLLLSGLAALTIPPLANLIGAARFNVALMVRILLLTSAIFFIPACLLGMISPVVVKLTLDNIERTGNIVGKIYAFSTLGSILGTFATGFFLISWMGTRNIVLVMGLILILSGVVFGGFFIRKKRVALMGSLLAVLLWSIYGYAFKPRLDDGTYFYKESNYYTIKLKQHMARLGEPVQALVLDHLIHSMTDLKDPLRLDYEYLQIFEELTGWRMAGKGAPKALFIGGGGYTFPRYLEARYPGAKIDVVEIDPEVTRVATTHLGIAPDTQIRSINEDARWFVMNARERGKYDFIFIDAFNDLSVPYHLTTREFAEQLKPLLAEGGILVANLVDSFRAGGFLPAYLLTLEEVFGKGFVHLALLSSDYEWIATGTCVVVASSARLDMADFTRRVQEEKGEEMVAHVVPADLLQQYLKKRTPIVLTDDYAPVDNFLAAVFEERFGYWGSR